MLTWLINAIGWVGINKESKFITFVVRIFGSSLNCLMNHLVDIVSNHCNHLQHRFLCIHLDVHCAHLCT